MSANPGDGVLSHRVLDVGWDMQALYDVDGNYLEVSAASERLFGWRPDELVGTSSYDYFHPDDLEAIRAAHDHVLADPSPAKVTYRLRCKDGSYRWVEVIGTAVAAAVEDERGRIHCATRDVTDRVELVAELRRATTELRDREERFRLTQQHAPVGLALVGLDGSWLEVNPALCHLLGRTQPELLAIDFQSMTHPADLDADLDHQRALIAGSADSYSLDKRYLRPDGAVVNARLSVAIVREPDGRPKYFISQILDLSDRVRAEEAERALERAHRLELVGRLAGGTAHQFNNLLAEILIELESVTDELEEHAQRTARSLGRIRSNVRMATDATRNLQIIGTDEPTTIQEVDLGSMVGDCVLQFEQAQGSTTSIEVDQPDRRFIVNADRDRLRTAMLAILVNAGDAVETGGDVTVEIVDGAATPGPTSTSAVDRTETSASWAVVRVVDTGTGMAPEVLDRAPEPFYSTRPGHSGIGLPVARRVLEEAGGALEIRSAAGVGTTVEMWFPAHETEVQSPPRHRSSGVLVVDDRPDLAALVARSLRSAGHEVWSTMDPLEALRQVEQDGIEIDVLVTDIVMPSMSGVELATRLRVGRPNLGIVLMSGFSGLADEVSTIEGHRFLAKPFSVKDLLDAVEQVGVSEAGGPLTGPR